MNEKGAAQCASCETPNPSAASKPSTAPVATVGAPTFQFGFGAATAAPITVSSSTAQSGTAFLFGGSSNGATAPAASAPPQFSFGFGSQPTAGPTPVPAPAPAASTSSFQFGFGAQAAAPSAPPAPAAPAPAPAFQFGFQAAAAPPPPPSTPAPVHAQHPGTAHATASLFGGQPAQAEQRPEKPAQSPFTLASLSSSAVAPKESVQDHVPTQGPTAGAALAAVSRLAASAVPAAGTGPATFMSPGTASVLALRNASRLRQSMASSQAVTSGTSHMVLPRTPGVPVLPSGTMVASSLGMSQSLRDSKWSCPGCFVVLSSEVGRCPACHTVNPRQQANAALQGVIAAAAEGLGMSVGPTSAATPGRIAAAGATPAVRATQFNFGEAPMPAWNEEEENRPAIRAVSSTAFNFGGGAAVQHGASASAQDAVSRMMSSTGAGAMAAPPSSAAGRAGSTPFSFHRPAQEPEGDVPAARPFQFVFGAAPVAAPVATVGGMAFNFGQGASGDVDGAAAPIEPVRTVSSQSFSFGAVAPQAPAPAAPGPFSFSFGAPAPMPAAAPEPAAMSFPSAQPSASQGQPQEQNAASELFKPAVGGHIVPGPCPMSTTLPLIPAATRDVSAYEYSKPLVVSAQAGVASGAVAKVAKSSQGGKLHVNNSGLYIYVVGSADCEQLGLGSDPKYQYESLESPVLLKALVKVPVARLAVGGMHTLALTAYGDLWSWGTNDDRALGRGGAENIPGRVRGVLEDVQVVAISAGDSNSGALDVAGKVYSWGTFKGRDGYLGFDIHGQKHAAAPVYHADLFSQYGSARTITSGMDHMGILTETGRAVLWGYGGQGQTGRPILPADAPDDIVLQQLIPQPVDVSETGTPSPGSSGAKTGTGAEANKKRKRQDEDAERVSVPLPPGVTALSGLFCASYSTFLVSSSGKVYALGLNSYGQCGLGAEWVGKDLPTPTMVPALTELHNSAGGVVNVVGGSQHFLFLTKDGGVYACGRADAGQLGLSDPKDMHSRIKVAASAFLPCQIPPTRFGGLPVVGITANSACSAAVTASGDLYTWGFGTSGQLGHGDSEDVNCPKLANPPAPAVKSKGVKNEILGRRVVCAGMGGQHLVILGGPADGSPLEYKDGPLYACVEDPEAKEEEDDEEGEGGAGGGEEDSSEEDGSEDEDEEDVEDEEQLSEQHEELSGVLAVPGAAVADSSSSTVPEVGQSSSLAEGGKDDDMLDQDTEQEEEEREGKTIAARIVPSIPAVSTASTSRPASARAHSVEEEDQPSPPPATTSRKGRKPASTPAPTPVPVPAATSPPAPTTSKKGGKRAAAAALTTPAAAPVSLPSVTGTKNKGRGRAAGPEAAVPIPAPVPASAPASAVKKDKAVRPPKAKVEAAAVEEETEDPPVVPAAASVVRGKRGRASAQQTVEPTPAPTQGTGRGRKAPSVASSKTPASAAASEPTVAKKRGRPAKIKEEEEKVQAEEETEEESPAPKSAKGSKAKKDSKGSASSKTSKSTSAGRGPASKRARR